LGLLPGPTFLQVYYQVFNQGKGTFLGSRKLPKGLPNQKGGRGNFYFFPFIIPSFPLVFKIWALFLGGSWRVIFPFKKGNFPNFREFNHTFSIFGAFKGFLLNGPRGKLLPGERANLTGRKKGKKFIKEAKKFFHWGLTGFPKIKGQKIPLFKVVS